MSAAALIASTLQHGADQTAVVFPELSTNSDEVLTETSLTDWGASNPTNNDLANAFVNEPGFGEVQIENMFGVPGMWTIRETGNNQTQLNVFTQVGWALSGGDNASVSYLVFPPAPLTKAYRMRAYCTGGMNYFGTLVGEKQPIAYIHPATYSSFTDAKTASNWYRVSWGTSFTGEVDGRLIVEIPAGIGVFLLDFNNGSLVIEEFAEVT